LHGVVDGRARLASEQVVGCLQLLGVRFVGVHRVGEALERVVEGHAVVRSVLHGLLEAGHRRGGVKAGHLDHAHESGGLLRGESHLLELRGVLREVVRQRVHGDSGRLPGGVERVEEIARVVRGLPEGVQDGGDVVDGGGHVRVVELRELDELSGQVLERLPGEPEPRVDFADGGARGLEVRRDPGREVLDALLHVLERLPGRAGFLRHDVEPGIHLAERGKGGRADRCDGRGHALGEGLPDATDLAADLLHRGAGLFQCGGDGGVGVLRFLFEVLEFLFGGDDLALPCVVLLLCDAAVPRPSSIWSCTDLSCVSLSLVSITACERSFCFWAMSSELVGSSLRSLFTSLSCDWVLRISLLTPDSAFERPVVSPPISTVMPLILSAIRSLLP
jgi:hypothetical protein